MSATAVARALQLLAVAAVASAQCADLACGECLGTGACGWSLAGLECVAAGAANGSATVLRGGDVDGGDDVCMRCGSAGTCGECHGSSACGWCAHSQECVALFSGDGADDCRGGVTGPGESCSIFTGQVVTASAVVFVGGVLAAGGGLGGGGIFIPTFALVAGFSPHVAIPMSKVTIMGVAIGGYLVNYSRRHPAADRPLIDYATASILEPMTLLGSVIGVFFNVLSPSWLIIVLLVMLLSYAALRTCRKGIRLHRAEEARLSAASTSPANNDNGDDDGDDDGGGDAIEMDEPELLPAVGDSAGDGDADSAAAPPSDKEELGRILRREARTIPWDKVGALGLVLLGTLVLVLFKGGGGDGRSVIGVRCGTAAYWLIILAIAPYLLAVTYYVGSALEREHETKQRVGYRFIEGDIHWTRRMLVGFPLAAVMAGVAAGGLGIGGGMIKGPLLLHMHVIPSVVAATSSFMILFTSSSTTFQFVVLGRLPVRLAAWFFAIGFASAVLGQTIVKKYLKRPSYIAFLIGAAILISVVAMSTLEVLQLVDDIEAGRSMGFQSLCSSE